MMKIGFIGTGSMGNTLIGALIRSGAVNPQQIIAANRTPYKAMQIAEVHPGLQVADTNIELAKQCDLIFLCIKPLQFKNVIHEIKEAITPSKIVISITSPVQIRHLESQLDGKIAKIIPSITNHMFEGGVLCMYGTRFTIDDQKVIEELISHIGIPVVMDEKDVRIASDISSCGPAFLAYFIQKFIDAAVEETGLTRLQAARLAAEMTMGTGKLLTAGHFTAEQLQQKVAVPGGITAEGLTLLERELGGVFNELVRITHAKYADDLSKLEEQFGKS